MARFSDEEVRRYARQMALAEVGGVGQERLRAARAHASDELEALYLAGAGVGTLVVPSPAIAEAARALNPLVTVTVAPEKFEHAFKKSNTRSNFEGSALRAVATLKEILAL